MRLRLYCSSTENDFAPGESNGKRDAGEGDYAVFIDIPLLVTLQCSTRLRHNLHKGINWRRSAPLQVVLIPPDQIPKTPCIGCIHSFDSKVILFLHHVHIVLVRTGRKLIPESHTHMGHIDTQHPEQTIFLSLSNLAQRPKKAPDMLGIFGKSACMHTSSKWSAQKRKYAHVRSVNGLQKDHLKFNRMFDRITIVLR